jgi:8-oxo-dGTP pyrophosphatase MutT (NUDIX family)
VVSPEELRERLASVVGGHEVVYGEEIVGILEQPPTPAAVLVPIILHPEPSLLLTRRTSHLKKHAGQVSFPGGRIDPEDKDAVATALREAEEEVGLDPTRVEIVGRMDEYVTGTGFIITPVIGLLPPGLSFRPSPNEVEAIFEFPFSVLLDPEAPQRQKQHTRGQWREYWVWPHPDHFIWGATAAIMYHLAGKLRCASRK